MKARAMRNEDLTVRSACRGWVIALHCSGASAVQWRELGSVLGVGYELTAPEHFGGHVSGPWTGERVFTLADEAERTINLIDGGRRRVHLIGHSYGGGVALHVALRRLAAEPDLLVCDEPVSSLDVMTQAHMLDLLVALQARLRLAMLFISHDLGVIQHVSHRIAVMEAGRIVETGTVDQVFDHPQHRATRRLLGAVPRLPGR